MNKLNKKEIELNNKLINEKIELLKYDINQIENLDVKLLITLKEFNKIIESYKKEIKKLNLLLK